jgi:hypothetical protein
MMESNTPIVPTPEWKRDLHTRFWRVTHPEEERIRHAIDLHKQGHTYQEIAERLGYGHRMSAHWAVNNSVVSQESRTA